ncbi:RNA-binding cell elongation regulator Jag/EloR [Spirochaeta cellobiosiphila]|uniref:RNA-binding cell elongation regulator Jag/EloR n=1 Tax=Spirochaeta cellobiosiphila TaxID=504483 RepID=UPI000427A197|nr:RNA-binding cell elongation regulator Jag/EloR [Spirochaeta cellobiosiphila]
MVKEFEGKTQKEAISKAVEELGLNQDEFDVEIVETEKTGFLFKKGKVKIRVHMEEESISSELGAPLVPNDIEEKVISFIKSLISKMGFPGSVFLHDRSDKKFHVVIESEHSGILIGKRGKNLDAIQLVSNVYLGRLIPETKEYRVVIDSENYRERREESLVRMAHRVASQVKKTKRSRLLEPMNPFERRLIHTALGELDHIETESEGEGLLKQIRVKYVD